MVPAGNREHALSRALGLCGLCRRGVDEGGGSAGFPLPQDEYVKWELRRLYYRQRNHHARFGRFTAELTELVSAEERNAFGIRPKVEAAGGRFEISAAASDGKGIFYIREDGKLWKERS